MTAEPTLAVVRNEVRADYEYHCDALASHFPDAREVDFPAGERFDPRDFDGVVLSGSTAGVYEADERPWIREQERLVQTLVERQVPTLGVCFGHQIANSALGGTVRHEGMTARLVVVEFADDPVFAGVEPVVAASHGDVVTDAGREMDVIASAEHCRVFGTRHRRVPLWTVQFHPEFTADIRDQLAEDFDWTVTDCAFADVNAPRVFENFQSLVAERMATVSE